ncbi:MAG TPA: hypothetical protein VGW40_04355 [Allosphingosinicella sp.]|nr:hypothetical protein [Allosphingosinicella sp.]
MSWTRRLNPKFQENPENLGDGVPGYRIRILHVVPKPVPEDVVQEYQVVKSLVLTIDDNCSLKFNTFYRLDCVDLGGRAEIPDLLALDYRDKEYCVVWELARHTIGFGSKTKRYEEVSNLKISESYAKQIIGEMTEPITTFTTTYLFSKGDCCTNLVKFLLWGMEPRRRDELRVDGLGDFPPPKPPKPSPTPPTPPEPLPPPAPKPPKEGKL